MDVKGRTLSAFCDFRKCYTTCEKSKILRQFFKDFPQLLVIEIDKSKNIEIISKSSYENKLNDIFSDNKTFEKLDENPLEQNIKFFNTTIGTLKNCVSKTTFRKIKPNEGLKKGFGILKKHKTLEPLRPIVSCVNSITEGSETFLANLIRPIVEKCRFPQNQQKSCF